MTRGKPKDDYWFCIQVCKGDEKMVFPLFRQGHANHPPEDLPALYDLFLEFLNSQDAQKQAAVMLANFAKARSDMELFEMEQRRLENGEG